MTANSRTSLMNSMRNDPIGKLLPRLAVRIKEARQPVNDALGERRIIITNPRSRFGPVCHWPEA